MGLKGVVLVNIEAGGENKALDEIAKTQGVTKVCLVYGAYDMVALIEAEDQRGLRDVVNQIRAVENVRSTLTMVVIEERGKEV